MNKNKITRLNPEVRNDKQSVRAADPVDVAKLQKLEAKNDGEKFSYGVGWKDDSGKVTLFDNGDTVFYGTQEDAEGLLSYANRTDGGPNWEIIRIG